MAAPVPCFYSARMTTSALDDGGGPGGAAAQYEGLSEDDLADDAAALGAHLASAGLTVVDGLGHDVPDDIADRLQASPSRV